MDSANRSAVEDVSRSNPWQALWWIGSAGVVVVAFLLVMVAIGLGCGRHSAKRERLLTDAEEQEEVEVSCCEVTIPDEWRGMLSVGELSFVGRPFYGVPWELGVAPVVRVNLPLKNLTSKPLYVWLSYRAEARQRGCRNTEMGAY